MLKIYRTVNRNLLTQGFGVANTHPDLLAKYQSFGISGHNGWDWSADIGDDVRWDTNKRGRVIETSVDGAGGLQTVVACEDNGKFYLNRYIHSKEFKAKVGDILESADLIASADNTGFSTGSHVHRDLKECDKDYKVLNYGNGYHGAIDMTPFFQNIYALDLKAQLEGQIKVLIQLAIEVIKKLLAKLT